MSSNDQQKRGAPPPDGSNCNGEENKPFPDSVCALNKDDLSDVINQLDSVDEVKEWLLKGKIDAKNFDKVLPFTAQDLRIGKTERGPLEDKLRRFLHSTPTIRGDDDEDKLEGFDLLARRLASRSIPEQWCRNDEQKTWLLEQAYPAFARDLSLHSNTPDPDIPSTNTPARIQKAVQVTCNEWAPVVDAVIFPGKQSGTFLFLCETYRMPLLELESLIRRTQFELVARRLAPQSIPEQWCRNDEQKKWLLEQAYPAFARDLSLRCDAPPHPDIPLTDIPPRIQKALQVTCNEWAPQVDAVIFPGKRSGTFLSMCETYTMSTPGFTQLVLDTLESIATDDVRKHTEHRKMIGLKVKQMKQALFVVCDFPFENSCWECSKVDTSSKSLPCCSKCGVARYCSRECQTKAWEGGHKRLCKVLRSEYSSFVESLGAIDRAHATGTIEGHKLNPPVDYILAFECQGIGRPFGKFTVEGEELFLPGPKMEYFYENLGRIFRGEWWVFDDPDTMEAYKAKLNPDGSSSYLSRVDATYFGKIADCLTYDIFGFVEDLVEDDAERAEIIKCLIGASVAGIEKNKAGVTMPVERFVELYDYNEEHWNKHMRNRLKANMKARTAAYFRNNFHK